MRNVKYIVKFVVNPMLDDEFDFKDEALAWAEEHLSEKPVVTAIDIEYPDEFGAEPIIYDSEEIFHYAAEEHPDEDKVDNAEKLSDLDNRLAELENEIDADPEGAALHRDFPEFESLNEKTQKSGKDVENTLDDFVGSLDDNTPVNQNQVAKQKPADILNDFVDSLDDNTPVNQNQVAKQKPADILNDFANSLGEDVEHQEEQVNDGESILNEDIILFDPFGCDFSECEPMEVCLDNHRADCCKDFNVNAVDFLKELAVELGIADEVEISEISKSDDPEEDKNVYVNVDTENIDNDTQGKIADAVTDAIGEVVPEGTAIGTGVGDVNPPAEPAEPEPADEISEISDEAKDSEDVVPEEVKANEEPNVKVQVEDEKPAEEIAKCHVCPKCGKEICESKDYLVAYIDCSGSRLQKRDEDAKKAKDLGAKKIFYFSNYVDRKPDPEIIGYGGDFNYVAEHIRQNKFNNVVIFTDKDINSPIGDSLRQMPNVKILIEKLAKESVCKKCGNKELVEKNKVTHTTGDPAIGDAHFNGAFEGGEGCSEMLKKDPKPTVDEIEKVVADKSKTPEEKADIIVEEHHPEEPQPEVDLVKVGTDARKMAAAYGKPVIYGYEGPDHHGGKRYFEIDPIVCDDLNKCRDDVMKKYHPSGSILVAYPDQLDEANNCDKEDKMLFVEEQEEMSDIEFAEALKKGLEEKHNCK